MEEIVLHKENLLQLNETSKYICFLEEGVENTQYIEVSGKVQQIYVIQRKDDCCEQLENLETVIFTKEYEIDFNFLNLLFAEADCLQVLLNQQQKMIKHQNGFNLKYHVFQNVKTIIFRDTTLNQFIQQIFTENVQYSDQEGRYTQMSTLLHKNIKIVLDNCFYRSKELQFVQSLFLNVQIVDYKKLFLQSQQLIQQKDEQILLLQRESNQLKQQNRQLQQQNGALKCRFEKLFYTSNKHLTDLLNEQDKKQ